MKKYKLVYTKIFHTKVQSLIRDNRILKDKLELFLGILLENPFSEALLTYEVQDDSILSQITTNQNTEVYITYLTREHLLIWELEKESSILLLTIRQNI